MNTVYIFVLSILLVVGCSGDQPNSILVQLEQPSQEYFLSTKSDTFLSGKEGTIIFIEEGSFVNSLGEVITDSVVVTLKELYSIADIINSNTTMRSGDQILETGGMIQLQAYANGEQLSLGHGRSLVVHFPRKIANDSMRLFYGDENEVDGSIGWGLEESSVPKKEIQIDPWYRKHKGLDDVHFTLSNGTRWYDSLRTIFNFSAQDVEYFLNKTSKIHYLLNKKGELEYEKINGSIITREMESKLEEVAKNFPKCQAYTIKGEPIDMIGHFQIWTELKAPKYMNKENYLNQIENRISNNDSTKSSISAAELQYYIFDSKKLGWMNCDQFINPNPIKTDFIVKVPKSENIFVKIIFTNYKTVMIGDEKKGKFIFENLPLDEPVKVIAIDEIDGKPMVIIDEVKISNKPHQVGKLQHATLEELKRKLDGLN